ncbi:MAG TPA: D-hexose-6-phosphate mutarotase [Sulfurovum sp.]|nr:D-hexose-6-phosphate mutarotase [Sulfurovum sp.]
MKKFEIENVLSIQTDKHAGDKIVIQNDFADAEIYLLGGHLTHFQPHGEEKVIYDGKESYILPPKSAHFGIPICWPWFGPHPTDDTKGQHGFARNSVWDIIDTEILSNGQTSATLGLQETKETLSQYPHTFNLELTFTIGKTLEVALKTINTSPTTMHITQALHSYFYVDTVQDIRIQGLEGRTFIDQLDNHIPKKEHEVLRFTQSLDRIYIPTSDTCEIIDTNLKRKICIKKEHSNSTVVWNPWEKSILHDVKGSQYQKFVCIETANVKEDIVTLNAGESYTLVQKISLESL